MNKYTYDIFYYFITNEKKGETVILKSDSFLGEVGEHIKYKDDDWKITDYAHEFFKEENEGGE